ncbi:MAG: conjugative relaxase, partial [Gammaproteobacteria bacterium]|nr:conjugative relaxase [Gammaproteobacteria bacterium]
MLSVVPIKQSSISSSYYLKQHDGYYLEDKNTKTLYQWFGKGAAELGLVGAIDNADHADVYSGKLPNGDVIGKPMPDGTLKGRPGYDLTFSMNKDLSLIICASYFLNAHINAVKTALTEVEKKVQARVSVNGVTQYQTTKNMLASLCTHFSSRAGDAEVHTHALIANATKRLDAKWRALATDMSRKNGFFEIVRDNAVYFGSLYQNEMAHAAKEKGFEVERIHKNSMFKITGFPDDLRDFFSKRRAQIVNIVKTLHPSVQNNKKVYDQVAQHSKANKTTLDQVSFFEKAKNDVADYLEKNGGKNFDGIIQNCLEKAKTINANNSTPSLSAIDAIKDAIAAQSQFSVKLDANKIINQGMELDLGHSTYGELLNAFNDTVTAKSLIPIENNRYTTAALIERENLLIKLVDVTRLSVITEPNSIKAKQLFLSDIIADFEKNNKKVRVLTLNSVVSNQYNEQIKKSVNTT